MIESRSRCLREFEALLGPCPLLYADFVLEHFVKVPFVKVSMEDYLGEEREKKEREKGAMAA